MANATWANKMHTAWGHVINLKSAIKTKYSIIQRVKWTLLTHGAPTDFSQYDAYRKHVIFCDLSGYINPSTPEAIFKNAKEYDTPVAPITTM